MGPQKAIRKSEKTAKPSFRIHTCPYPGRLAYIHAHPWMIVSIDTIASGDGGHRGRWGGTGVDSGGGRIYNKYETLCMVADMGV